MSALPADSSNSGHADDAARSFERNAPYAPTPDNRPELLEYSPLALTREAHSQMSFGERAALEGILAQLRPRLAVEIGTAEGGSLARIASYSEEVHSIDLTHELVAVAPAENVILHTGPSQRLLPKMLTSFAGAGRAIDLVLVDGDHSYEGVASDLRMLLESSTTRRSVIIVHDSINEEVRAGVESIGLDDYEKVVYYELDFVPGYIYRRGSARHHVWGGLGLILCDEQRSPAYSPSPRQGRYYDAYAAIHRMRAQLLASTERESLPDDDQMARQHLEEIAMLRSQLVTAETELLRQARALEVIYTSRSWRITAPARAAVRRMRANQRSRLRTD